MTFATPAQAALTLTIPASKEPARVRRPGFISPGTKSVVVHVNAAAPQIFNTIIGSSSCHSTTSQVRPHNNALVCTLLVKVPYGSDRIVVSTYVDTNGGGAMLDHGGTTVMITRGSTHAIGIILAGVPSSVAIGTLPPGVAGTPFSAPRAFSVFVRDAAGNVIAGTYTFPIVLSTSSSTGISLATTGADHPPVLELLSSHDSASLNYTGLAIAPVTIHAKTSTGSANTSAVFTPELMPPTLAAACAQSADACSSGTVTDPATVQFTTAGDTATLTPAEMGWTNAPYSRSFTLKSDTCNKTDDPSAGGNFVILIPAVGKSAASFTLTADNAGTSGDPANCTAVFVDGTGHTVAASVEVTLGSIGVH